MKTKTILLTCMLMTIIVAGCAMAPQDSSTPQRTQEPVYQQDVDSSPMGGN